jgi:hypothetical protein
MSHRSPDWYSQSSQSLDDALAGVTEADGFPGEDVREYAELCAELRGQFRPRTTAEAHKIDDMAQAWWLQRRARNLQTSALEQGDEKGFALYLRYETTQRRGYQMAYKDFRDMQKARLSLQSSPDTTPIVEAGFFQSERHYATPSEPAAVAPEAPDHSVAA